VWEPIADLPVRFAVGAVDGLTSNSWKVWTGRDGTIYLACRDNYQEVKASLHPTRWQFGLTSEAHHSVGNQAATRHFERWDPPLEFAPGAQVAFRLTFIHSEIAVPPDLRLGRRWDEPWYVEPAPGFDQTVVTLFITDAGVELRSSIGDTIVLARVPLADASELQLTVHGEPMTDELRAGLWSSYVQSIAAMPPEMPTGGRVLLFGRHDNGSRFLTELNAFRSRPDPLFGAFWERSEGQEK
jgi:hypothetical protein